MSRDSIGRTAAFADVQAIFTILPDRFKSGLLAELKAFEPRLLAREKDGVPVRHGPRPAKFAASRPGLRPPGGAASLLSTSLDADTLTLRSGLLSRQAGADGFTAFILDVGRGQRASRTRPRSRLIAAAKVQGRYGLTHRYTVPYSRAISPISPGRYSITFGTVREWARAETGPVLARIYDRAVLSVAWSKVMGG